MVWFRVDDDLAFHRKSLKAGNAAMGLWVRAGAECASQLLDGFVPDEMALLIGTRALANKLVDAGLWHRVDGGFRFHQWEDRQPTKADVEADRRANAARQKVFRSPHLRDAVRKRDGDRCRYCGVLVAWNDRRGAAGGTYDHVIPDGPTDEANLVVCCRGCNASKGRRTPEQAGMHLRPVLLEVRSDLDTTQVGTGSKQGSSRPPTRPDPDPLKQKEPLAAPAAQRDTKTRQPDPLWDSLIAACGYRPEDITASLRGSINGALKQLRDVDATPAQVTLRARNYRSLFPDTTLTAPALAKHWAACAASNGNGTSPSGAWAREL